MEPQSQEAFAIVWCVFIDGYFQPSRNRISFFSTCRNKHVRGFKKMENAAAAEDDDPSTLMPAVEN